MTIMKYEGYVKKFGDDINTDYIISSRRKRDTLDVEILKKYIFEDIKDNFYEKIKDQPIIIVASENFGCGSAMEVAAHVVKANNVDIVIAKSFARSYYRNAINSGILLVEMDTDDIEENDYLKVKIEEEIIIVYNETKQKKLLLPSFDDDIRKIIACGGIVNYVKSMY